MYSALGIGLRTHTTRAGMVCHEPSRGNITTHFSSCPAANQVKKFLLRDPLRSKQIKCVFDISDGSVSNHSSAIIALTQIRPSADGRKEEPTTVGQVYETLVDGHFKLDDCSLGICGNSVCRMTIKTDTDELEVLGPDFHLSGNRR